MNAVGTAATAMRAKLGESRSSIQKLNRPLEEATTGSLEALQNYTEGRVLLDQGRFLAARPLFERAIALDPNFATAYFYVAVAFNNAGDTAREAEYYRKAFALIDRVSEYERVSIAGGYYGSTGELDKEMDGYRLGTENYPRAWGFPNNLSQSYINLGEFEEGLKQGQTANQLQPNAEPPYRRLLDAYLCLGRLDEARKVAERARMQGINGARIHQRFLEMAYVEDDQAAVSREIQWYAGKPEEYLSLGLQAAYLNVLGRRRESSGLYKRAAETALRSGFGSVAADFEEAMRVPTRSRETAIPCVAWDVRRWRWRCAEMRPKQKSSPRRLRSVFPMEFSGTQCNYPRFALLSSSIAVSLPERWNY